MVHIWHEDSENSAQTQFWRFLSSYIPELASADIKGFNGNMYLANKKKTSGIKAQNIWNKSKARSIINRL